MVVALCATDAVVGQTHHRVPKSKPSAYPQEKNRDSADLALDRRSKGICRGCWDLETTPTDYERAGPKDDLLQ
jgi:hypothetical protein